MATMANAPKVARNGIVSNHLTGSWAVLCYTPWLSYRQSRWDNRDRGDGRVPWRTHEPSPIAATTTPFNCGC